VEIDTVSLKAVAGQVVRRLGLRDSPRRALASEWYLRHNQRRHEHFDSLGLDLCSKRAWIFAELRRHAQYVHAPFTQPAHPEFPLNWGAVDGRSMTRAVFVASRAALGNPQLVDSLPNRQLISLSGQGNVTEGS
jgi:hypothetical protein